MTQVFELVSKLIGKPFWGARRSNGSSFFIEVGIPHLRIREPSSDPDVKAQFPALARRKIVPVGEFSILILDSAWSITDGIVRVTDNDEVEVVDNAINSLNGGYLLDINENFCSSVMLSFDSGVTLTIEPHKEAKGEDKWNIRMPDGTILALHEDGTVSM